MDGGGETVEWDFRDLKPGKRTVRLVDCPDEPVAIEAVSRLPLRIRADHGPALMRQFIECALFVGPSAS
jgi:hypothetical protein